MDSAFAGPMKRNTSAVVPWAGDVTLLIVQKDLSSGSLAKSMGNTGTLLMICGSAMRERYMRGF